MEKKSKLNISLCLVYKIAQDASLIYEEYGYWSYGEGLIDLRTTPILSKRRQNLKKHQLIAATVFMEKGSENHTDLDDYQFVANSFKILLKSYFLKISEKMSSF